MNEVKQHQTDGAMWTVLKGRVYNIAPYMKFHPGGTDIILVLTCQIIVPLVFFWNLRKFTYQKRIEGEIF